MKYITIIIFIYLIYFFFDYPKWKKRKQFLKRRREFVNRIIKDPVYGCELYREKGCAHVDGMLCGFPKCSMLEEYRNKKPEEKFLKAGIESLSNEDQTKTSIVLTGCMLWSCIHCKTENCTDLNLEISNKIPDEQPVEFECKMCGNSQKYTTGRLREVYGNFRKEFIKKRY